MNDKNDILLINRDRDFLKTTCESLQKTGFSVATAMDMRSALTVISASSVGLIICDKALEDVSGYDFLHYLKSDPMRDSIPFVFFVPVNDQGRALKALKLGASDFLVYPLELDDLVKRIREILNKNEKINPSPQPQPDEPHAQPATPFKPATEVQPTEAAALETTNRRKSKRNLPLPPLNLEVSRDGMLWMPCKIKNFSREGMYVETSLLGKPGAELKLRISFPKRAYTLNGQITHINFAGIQGSTGIGIEIVDTKEWRGIYKYFKSFIGVESTKSETDTSDGQNGADGDAETLMISDEQAQALMASIRASEGQKAKSNRLDIRFYHSIVGKQLDNYKAVSFIGAGNMGGVFKGWDVSLEREVALKVISYDLSSQEKFRDMFIKEARIVSQLENPNIARIYYIGNANDILFYAMEFIGGGTLLDMINEGRNFNTLSGLDYLITICKTLNFVRQKNIIHRDIKPENIMIINKKIIKIVDFGVAKRVDLETKKAVQKGIVGSPLYIPPECIESKPLDHRSDIYSLGATFYHAFTGSPPFQGKNAEEVFAKHLHGKLTPLKKKNPKVSNALAKIIEKMMEKDPDDRYQTYDDIVDAINTLKSRALKFQKLKNATLIFKMKDNKAAPAKG